MLTSFINNLKTSKDVWWIFSVSENFAKKTLNVLYKIKPLSKFFNNDPKSTSTLGNPEVLIGHIGKSLGYWKHVVDWIFLYQMELTAIPPAPYNWDLIWWDIVISVLMFIFYAALIFIFVICVVISSAI